MKKLSLKDIFNEFKNKNIFLNRKTFYKIFLSLKTQIPELLDSPVDDICINQLNYMTDFKKKKNKIFFYTYLRILIEFALKFKLISNYNIKLLDEIKKYSFK